MSEVVPLPSPETTQTGRRRWLLDGPAWLFLAAVAYIPSFLTQPGKVAADTKQYLYLDPGRLIQSAISLWNPDVGAGTVTHENIGYLFPMGPYYWVVQRLDIPMWVGQRFWMGSLFFAAGAGAWMLCRLLGISRTGQIGAALTYMLTPFVIDEIARQSGIITPWAALGWLMAFTVLALRMGHWRYPALFAIGVALVGGVNATSILLIGLAPLLWLFYAVLVTKEASGRDAWKAALRNGVLSLGVSLWWISGLWAEGAYGINILKYTETLPTVSLTSLSSEVLRGLGYWYFYGQDKLQSWTSASEGYTQWPWLIAVSFAVPTMCFVFAMLARWRYRAFAVGLIVVGVVVAVGAYPYSNPTPIGNLIKTAGSDSTVGLAMRSSNRIVPVVVLGMALLLGAGIAAITRSVRWLGLLTLVLAAALLAANLPPLWDGTLVASNLDRPSALPRYITDAASYLNAQNHDTRILELPGEDFAYYRWGVASDPVWPGLMTRSYLLRGTQPQGEASSVNLLQALDESIQDGVFVPSTLAPIARLFSAGDLLFESDVQWERFNNARPQPFWLALRNTAGLSAPVTFGKPVLYKTIEYPLTDETQLAIPTGASIPPPVAVFAIPHARTIVRAETPQAPLVVDGDGQGLVNAAAVGLLDNNPTIFYSASAARNPASPSSIRSQLARGAILVLTDTNDKALSTWGTLDDDYGYVETANEQPLVTNPSEVALPVFPGARTNTQTVAEVSQVASVRATAYGNPITNTPENRPYQAIDGNPDTAWTEGAFSAATDQSLQIALTHRVTTDHITVLQPQKGSFNRHVTEVTLAFDGTPKDGLVDPRIPPRPRPGLAVSPHHLPHAVGDHRCHERGHSKDLQRRERRWLRGREDPRRPRLHRDPAPPDRHAERRRSRLGLSSARHHLEPCAGPGDTAAERSRAHARPPIHAAHDPALLHRGARPHLDPGAGPGDQRHHRPHGGDVGTAQPGRSAHRRGQLVRPPARRLECRCRGSRRRQPGHVVDARARAPRRRVGRVRVEQIDHVRSSRPCGGGGRPPLDSHLHYGEDGIGQPSCHPAPRQPGTGQGTGLRDVGARPVQPALRL